MKNMKNVKTFEFIVPTWVPPPLVNADYTGVSDVEEERLVLFEDVLQCLLTANNGSHYTLSFDMENIYFSQYNDIDDLGGDVCACTVIIFE